MVNRVTQENYTFRQFFIVPYHYLKYYVMWKDSKIKQFPETQCCVDVRADGNKYIMAFQMLELHLLLLLGTTFWKKESIKQYKARLKSCSTYDLIHPHL